MSLPAAALALLAVLALAATAPQDSRVPVDSFEVDLSAPPPFGLPEAFVDPAGAPFSKERFELGRELFFDARLSLDRTVACATCHRPEHGFAEPQATSIGVMGRKTPRNAPTLFNRGFGAPQMWDGKSPKLELQVLLPIENELEMALPLEDALERLRAEPGYRTRFAAAFGKGGERISREQLALALATYVGRLSFGDSPIDRFRTGAVDLMTSQERAGMWLFESRGGCWRCHAGPNFSDESFHNTGVGAAGGVAEPGRESVTGDPADRGRFKTPTLRALAFTAPYMHDGSLSTLEEVVDHYTRGGNPNPNLDERLAPFELDAEEKAALVAFLRALSRTGPPPK
jgi:cytochrome c peroxidase